MAPNLSGKVLVPECKCKRPIVGVSNNPKHVNGYGTCCRCGKELR